MLVVIDNRSVMARFARRLVQQKVYKISDFIVCLNHDPKETKFHLCLQHNSSVERVDMSMPEHR